MSRRDPLVPVELLVVTYSNVVDVPRGAERYAWGEAEVLASVNVAFASSSSPTAAPFRQFTIGAWTRRLYNPFGRPNPARLAVLHLLSLFNPLVFVESLRLFRRIRPRVVHTHNVVALSPAVWLAARLAGARVVHTHHDVWLLCERATLTDKHGQPCNEAQLTCLLCRSLRPVKRLQLELVSSEVFPSDWVRRRLGRRGEIMPSFATGSVDTPSQEPVTDGPVVFVGALTAHKGVRVLLDAFRLAARSLPGSPSLVIGGSGPLEQEVSTAAATDESIFFAGELEPRERDELLRRAALLVIPSTCAENSPLVFFEALAAGLPVIVSDAGGMPELQRYGNVKVVPPGDPEALADALVDLLGSTDRLRELALAARRNRNEAFPDRYAQQMQALLAETSTHETGLRRSV